MLCFGVARVDKILNFTEPEAGRGGGAKESTVIYTVKLPNAPSWYQTLASGPWSGRNFVADFADNSQGKGHKAEAQMVLTHLGWRVEAIDDQIVHDDD
jgi:hypothetical protein